MSELNPELRLFGQTIRVFTDELKDLEKILFSFDKVNVECQNGEYFFQNLAYNGSSINAKLVPNVIKDNNNIVSNNVSGWQAYQQESGKVVMNLKIFYQVVRHLMHSDQTKEVVACRDKLRDIFNQYVIHTGMKIEYKVPTENSAEATLSYRDIDGQLRTETLQVPEFTKQTSADSCAYILLAKKQSSSKHGTVEQIPENAKPLLQALFGEGYEEAGAVFQYLSKPCSDGELREVRVWAPALNTRSTERAVVLYINDSDWFYIDACGYINLSWPALWVVVGAPKN
ncbi:MAG: hypothetical protein HY363_05275 [Candidatus Aenigmarchaeota archaeon]|nr:hypothetical protein [Candidatus Aenigmarchaeota archaeon]